MSYLPKCIDLRVVRSNKKERTITIRKEYDDNSAVFYKSCKLPSVEFRYYTQNATYGDLAAFLKSDDYVEIGYTAPNRK